MMTTKQLIAEYNELAASRELPLLAGWKGSKEALQAKIDGSIISAPNPLDTNAAQALGDAKADAPSAEAVEGATEHRTEPASAPDGPAKPWTIGAMVKELLLDPAGYDYPTIVEAVRRAFPKANTSTRSVASVAAALRRDGMNVPMRRRASVKADEGNDPVSPGQVH